MMIINILVAGIVIGMLPGIFKLDKTTSIPNMIVGFLGAFIGAFIGFGDAPLLLQNPFLNEITLMIIGAFLLVFGKVFITRQFGVTEKAFMIGMAVIIGLLAGVFIGANIGGNYFVDFAFLGARGYEVAGLLGGIVGVLIVIGAAIGITKIQK